MNPMAEVRSESAVKFARRGAGVAVLLLLAVSGALAGNRPAPEPVFLGHAQVGKGLDHDTIVIRNVDGAFRAIQLRVNGGDVQFRRLMVRYQDGSRQVLPVPYYIRSGGRSPAITLSGGRHRVVRAVDLWYSKTDWSTRPRVAVFGYR